MRVLLLLLLSLFMLCIYYRPHDSHSEAPEHD